MPKEAIFHMEMNPKDSSNHKGPGNPGEKRKPKWLLALIVAVGAVILIGMIYNVINDSKYTKTTFSDFLDVKNAGELRYIMNRLSSIPGVSDVSRNSK